VPHDEAEEKEEGWWFIRVGDGECRGRAQSEERSCQHSVRGTQRDRLLVSALRPNASIAHGCFGAQVLGRVPHVGGRGCGAAHAGPGEMLEL